VPIRALYPGMSYATYSLKIKDPLFLYETAKICDSCYEFIKNVQDCIEIKKLREIESRNSHNADLSKIKSVKKQRTLKSSFTDELVDRNFLGVLNEQGMMVSKTSSISAKKKINESVSDAFSSRVKKSCKERLRSGIPRPNNLIHSHQEEVAQSKGLSNFYSVKPVVTAQQKVINETVNS